MSMIGRRDLLLALAALGTGLATAGGVSAAVLDGIDVQAAAKIGAAWRAARPNADLQAVKGQLGAGEAGLRRLAAMAREDFRAGRVFVHRGWRLSDTEGALMALVAAG